MAGKSSTRRPEQVAETIRAVLAEALLRGELRDPRIGLVTVSAVDVTRDLSHATIIVVPHGDDAARDEALEGLVSAAGYLRRIVAKTLTTRIVPELHFQLDRGFEHAKRIDELLAGLREDDDPASRDEQGPATGDEEDPS